LHNAMSNIALCNNNWDLIEKQNVKH